MARVPGTPRSIFTFYRKAESVVAYLIKEYGVEPFQQPVGGLAQGHTADDALVRAYGFGISELEARWVSDSRLSPAPVLDIPAGRAPWDTFGAAVMVVLAIVGMMFVVEAKIRMRG